MENMYMFILQLLRKIRTSYPDLKLLEKYLSMEIKLPAMSKRELIKMRKKTESTIKNNKKKEKRKIKKGNLNKLK